VTGVLIGVYLDVLTYYFNARTAYCCMAVWSLIAHILSFIAMAGLYRSWQRYGGDETYEPPVPK
jgi:hypothetical protein